jgi:small subunit ribosomal protein S13
MRIAGVELKDNWKIDYALTQIKGIGWSLSKKILTTAKIDSAKRVADLTTDEISRISGKIEKQVTEGELIRGIRSNIQRLQAIGSYRGLRHQKHLPSRGQRTRSNARTLRGKRKTVGAFKKEVLSKTKEGAAKEKGKEE